mmetsp:Transcript_14843/g.42136  ORF Transcript_14843/g.42136 Transcript_14843/m.42136 type:complete len:139 (+) Transcript_14843:83-499(+)
MVVLVLLRVLVLLTVVLVTVVLVTVMLVAEALLVAVVVVSVVLVQVALTVVTVAVMIFISAGAILNEDSTISMPCDWKDVCNDPLKLAVSLAAAFAASKIFAAESTGATISIPTSHEVEDARAGVEAIDTDTWSPATP